MQSNPITVDCAGLVLCGPFIEHMFGHLGYTEAGIFRDEYMPFRAAELLKYVAAGESVQHAPANALTYVLCGIQPDAPGAHEVILTSDEKNEAELMLQSLILNWNAMRGLSTDSFRKSFLNREGELTFRERWELNVSHAAADMLLDAVPWSLRLLKLPWMKYPLQTNWI